MSSAEPRGLSCSATDRDAQDCSSMRGGWRGYSPFPRIPILPALEQNLLNLKPRVRPLSTKALPTFTASVGWTPRKMATSGHRKALVQLTSQKAMRLCSQGRQLRHEVRGGCRTCVSLLQAVVDMMGHARWLQTQTIHLLFAAVNGSSDLKWCHELEM